MDEYDADEQRTILRRVVAYKEVCDRVRRSSTGGLLFGALMLFIWYVMPDQMKYKPFGLFYLGLACLEFTVALWNRFAPAPEGVLFDGLVLLLFGGSNIARNVLPMLGVAAVPRGTPWMVAFGIWMLLSGIGHVRSYFELRRHFTVRPTREHLRWFDGLVREIRRADPETDPTALDLPTRPPLRAKLLGDTAIFLQPKGELIVAAREDVRIKMHGGDERRKRIDAELRIDGQSYGDFDLDPDNWRNYTDWKKAGGEDV